MNVRRGDVDQLMLVPPSIRDWLPEDHLAFFVLDTVQALDLGAFYAVHRIDGRGGAVYDPAMMLAVLLYAYATGERSSRRIEQSLVEHVAYRVIAANQQPDHATLARFRRRHQDAIADLFGQMLRLCMKAGLVDAAVVAIDGTKVTANASFFANRKHEALTKEMAAMSTDSQPDGTADAVDQAAREVLDEAEATDAAEDAAAAEEGEQSTNRVPASWAGGRDRKARIRAALDEIDAQQARDYETRMAQRAQKEAATGKKTTGPKPKKDAARRSKPRRANTTDPHSRIIPTSGRGVMQGYNAQAAATSDQIVVAAEATATTNDQPHFLPMTTAVNQNLTAAGHAGGVGTFLADAGYWTAANGTTDVGAAVLMPTKKSAWRKAAKPDDDKLAILAKVNRGELSQRKAGDMLGVSYTWISDMTKRYFGTEGERITRTEEPPPEEWIPIIAEVDRGERSKRSAKHELTVSDQRIKTMLAHVRGEAVDPAIARKQMDDRLAEPDNEELYKQRAATIEPVFGNIKQNLGLRQFSRRSLPAVNSEWRLICTVHNMLKLQTAAT